jgi:hypothetical protein
MDYDNRIKNYNILDGKLKDKDDCLKKETSTIVGKGGSAFIYVKNVTINNNDVIVSLKEQKIVGGNRRKLILEYEILKKCTKLVLDGITQNLPMIYDMYICEQNKFVFYNELATGDFVRWCYQKHTIDEWKSFLFQFWAGVYTLQKYLKLVHNDLRLGNVLYHKINISSNKTEYWKYIIDGKEYYIPNTGYVFVIWDFGSSDLIQSDNDVNKNKLNLNIDLHFFHDLYNRLRVLVLSENYNICELEQYFKTTREVNYMNAKKKECEKKFKKSCRFDEKYKISLIYYLIENDIPDVNYTAKSEESYKLPPPEIMKMLKELSDRNYRYEDVLRFIYKPKSANIKKQINSPNLLIEQYFSEFKVVQPKYTHEFII